jgi:MFS family permease
MPASVEKNKMRTFTVRMLGGAIFGAAVTGLFLSYFGDPLLDLKDGGTMLAVTAGLIYLLIGVMMWIGMAAPSVGAHFLNVEDADELREESPKLRSGVVVLILIGVFLLTLAFAGAGVVSTAVALGISAGCLAGVVVAGWHGARRYDEMTKRMGEEVASATLQVTMLGLGAWAALAQLGYVAWVGPLALVSGLALLQLFVSFVVVARKGMLMPR